MSNLEEALREMIESEVESRLKIKLAEVLAQQEAAKYIDIDKFCEMYGTSRQTALQWHRLGEVNFERSGTTWRVALTELERFNNACEQRAEPAFGSSGFSPIEVDGDLPTWAREAYRITRRNAERRKIPFHLPLKQYGEIVKLSKGCCMVSGLPFDLRKYPGSCRRPFAPSLDRIDSTKGYSADNCRLVSVLVNLAMNQWGVEPLLRVARNIVARERELQEQETSKRRWRSPEHVTIKEFLSQRGDPSSGKINSLTSRAKRYCKENGIDYLLVDLPDYQRKDGSWAYSPRAAFPRSALEAVAPVQEVQP